MSYTNSTLVGNFLRRTLTANEISFLAVLIPGVKNWIDLKTDTTFDQAAGPTQRFYDGGDQYIDTEPFTGIPILELIDDYGVVNYTYQSYDHVTLPQNFDVKTQIKYRYGSFPSGSNRLRVTATFSSYDAGVPEDIQAVATRLCAVLLNNRVVLGLERESLEGHLVMYNIHALMQVAENDPVVKSILGLRREILFD